MCNGGLESGLQTFRRREEVVAVAPPTGESNPVASGRSGGEIPIMGVSHQAARFSRRAPSVKRARIGGMEAGMVHKAYRLCSWVEGGMEAALSTCSNSNSTTPAAAGLACKRLASETHLEHAGAHFV